MSKVKKAGNGSKTVKPKTPHIRRPYEPIPYDGQIVTEHQRALIIKLDESLYRWTQEALDTKTRIQTMRDRLKYVNTEVKRAEKKRAALIKEIRGQ